MNFATFELLDANPQIEVQEEEYIRLLGYPRGYRLQGRARELADQAREWYATHGRPWMFARGVDDFNVAGHSVRLNQVEFKSKRLVELLDAASALSAVVVAVSAGIECEEKARGLWHEQKPDEYFFLEVFGSAVVEHLIALASGHICGWADSQHMSALPHYSPGYSEWDVAEQIKLWELIKRSDGSSLPGVLSVLESGMLRPKKSLLALMGLTRMENASRLSRSVPCESCSLARCQYRRVPYVRGRPQAEDVRRLQRLEPEPASDAAVSPLRRDANYSVNSRALRKWTHERLKLVTRSTGDLEAVFRYEGTTCANQGRTLEFLYRVVLSPARDAYRVLDARCAPAPDDTGHTQQCEYLNNAEALMTSIANERPLIGRPLEDVLNWHRAANPAGCFCEKSARDHKWGLVYEVIHFALAHPETRSVNGSPVKELTPPT